MYIDSVDLGDRVVSVTVVPEMTFATVTSALDSAGALERPWLFKLAARLSGVDRRLWVGRYDFTGAVSTRSILDDFRSGNVATFSLTLPEGLTVARAAGVIAGAFKVDSAVVVAQCYDTALCRERFGLDNLEGYLFPETYSFPIGTSLDRGLEKMVGETRLALSSAASDSDDFPYSLAEALTLASIIEAEARVGAERRTISSVYHNRLRQGMLLQADPTVRFALGRFNGRLYYKHLEVNSPYNTYKFPGLPPGPINSPGAAAIAAAFDPEDTDYLYFVADGTGRHVFTRTLADHNRAKNSVRR